MYHKLSEDGPSVKSVVLMLENKETNSHQPNVVIEGSDFKK